MANWVANIFFGKNRGENDENGRSSKTSETTPGDEQPVQWEVVARFPGLIPAQITADRLISEGVPARAWQEGAGQALGLTVGLLGTGYVTVPAEFVDQALDILEVEYDEEE